MKRSLFLNAYYVSASQEMHLLSHFTHSFCQHQRRTQTQGLTESGDECKGHLGVSPVGEMCAVQTPALPIFERR